MLRGLIFISCLLISSLSQALDIENAKRINRTCALCHGIYGQGTPGMLSPRLAGLPVEYLAKELKYYRDGVREYAPMVVASSIKSMSDEDIQDISEYLAGVNLRNMNLPKIPEYAAGIHTDGQEAYFDECKSCHKKTGLGKPKKGIPPLAGQYGSYLFGQLKKFQAKDRYHDDDPEDDTFDEWNDKELDNIVAFLTRLPPHGPIDKAEPFAMTMAGMAEVLSMGGMIAASPESAAKSATVERIAGRFRITPEGDILLKPNNRDMRRVAGLSGDFQVSDGGILFIPR